MVGSEHVGDGGVEHLHEGAERQRDGGDRKLRASERPLLLLCARAAHDRYAPFSVRMRWISRSTSGPPSVPASPRIVRATVDAATGPEVSLTSTSAETESPTRSGWFAQLARIERDAHRYALHDLDPVAAGVFAAGAGRRHCRCRRQDLRRGRDR